VNKLALALVVLSPGLGCVHFQPIGPLTKDMTVEAAAVRPTAEGKGVAPKAAVPTPVIQPAPAPAPPALLVTPAEVTEANHADAVHRLMQELEADRRSMESMPRPAEISVIRKN
jgi:hypothetical protein